MLITSLEIENFRRFDHFKCDFDSRFTLLVGPNGAGKSSLLQSIFRGFWAMLTAANVDGQIQLSDVRRSPSVDPGSSSWRTPVFPARIRLSLKSGTETFRLLCRRDAMRSDVIDPEPELQLVSGEDYQTAQRLMTNWFHPESTTSIPLIARFGAANTVQGSGTAGVVAQPFQTRQQVWQRTANDSVNADLLAQWFQYNELRTLQEGAAPLNYRVAREAVLQAIHATDIRYVVRDNQLMILHPDQGWRPFDQLSDGQRRIAAIFCELALRCASLNSHLGEACIQETTGVATIDELDLHLHPAWQRCIIADLTRVFPMIQFIAASHSPFLLQAAYEVGKVLDVSKGQFVEPTDHSIEDIAESVMGVPQPQRGHRFLELKERAQAFYELLETQPTDEAQRIALKLKLDESLAAFANDPAAAAWLEQRRVAAGH